MKNDTQTNRPPYPASTVSEIDPRVAVVLAEAGLEYEEFTEGNCCVTLLLEPGLSESVVVSSRTVEVASREQRRIFTVGCTNNDPCWGENLWRTLLQLNGMYNAGMWEITTRGEFEVAIFSVSIPADASAEEMRATLTLAALNSHDLKVLLQHGLFLN